MIKTRCYGKILLLCLLWTILPDFSSAQMNMNPYFTAINYPVQEHSFMLMAMPDFQSARYGSNFVTAMMMAEYGISTCWTFAAMIEGQKIARMPVTYGGFRLNTYYHLFLDDRFLNITLYFEYEDLNGAALYKMEVAGFGSEDLIEPLAIARAQSVQTFEQRIIIYHDWNRLNATLNFIRESALQEPFNNDYGYALGLFIMPVSISGSMDGMSGMSMPPPLSPSRFGYGLEMIGALGNSRKFGIDWNAQQHYLGAVIMYTISSNWTVRLEPAFGLSDVSDPFLMRTGFSYMFGLSDL